MMKSLQAHVPKRRKLKVSKGSPNVLVKGRVFTLKELGHHINSKCAIYSTIQVTAPIIL